MEIGPKIIFKYLHNFIFSIILKLLYSENIHLIRNFLIFTIFILYSLNGPSPFFYFHNKKNQFHSFSWVCDTETPFKQTF